MNKKRQYMFLPRVTPVMVACEKIIVWEKSAFLEWGKWKLLSDCSIFFSKGIYSFYLQSKK